MRGVKSTIPPEAWEEARQIYPFGARCPVCGERKPIEEFGLKVVSGKRYRRHPYCRDCRRVYHRVTEGDGNPPPVQYPVPSLEVGRQYRIVDRSWTINGFADEDSKPMIATFVGRCVAKYGRNWAILTGTGIRCFTQGQLVGLDIAEVG